MEAMKWLNASYNQARNGSRTISKEPRADDGSELCRVGPARLECLCSGARYGRAADRQALGDLATNIYGGLSVGYGEQERPP